MKKTLPKLVIQDLEVDMPIIQGGMGVGISMANLASAVANEGGVGVIASVGVGRTEKDANDNYVEANQQALKEEIKKARSSTDGIIGINIMAALSSFDSLLVTSVKEEVDLVLLGAGLPIKLPEELPLNDLESVKTKFVPIVSSGKAADLIIRQWLKRYDYLPDAIVLEGPLAGGHLGFSREQIESPEYTLEKLLSETLEVADEYENKYGKDIPVIAAGGIYTGEDIYKILQAGASGVQMGTRFVPTEECDASTAFKESYIRAEKDDIEIIDSPVGMPGRAIKNEFLLKAEDGKVNFQCDWKCLKSCDIQEANYCIAEALVSARIGAFDQGFPFAGANAYRTEEISTVRQVFESLKGEYSDYAESVETRDESKPRIGSK